MRFCWHDWSKWSELKTYERMNVLDKRYVNGIRIYQHRVCNKCNKQQVRKIDR